MFSNKEETKLLSDDDFERVGRRRKTVIFITIFIIIVIAAILAFKLINKNSDNDINVEKQEISTENDEKVEDETTVSGKDTVAELKEEGADIPSLVNRNTVTDKNEFICEYSEIHLPELLKTGDFADVRLSLADGRNYTVVSEKQIMDFNKSEEKSLVYLALCEEEIIILESALADLKLFEGSKLYLVIGRKEDKNKVNYPVNKNADKLLHVKKGVNNLSDYEYEVKFDKELEKERLIIRKTIGLKGQEWKEAATYWNEKE